MINSRNSETSPQKDNYIAYTWLKYPRGKRILQAVSADQIQTEDEPLSGP